MLQVKIDAKCHGIIIKWYIYLVHLCTPFALCQSVGRGKTVDPREKKTPGTPASRTCLVSHLPRMVKCGEWLSEISVLLTTRPSSCYSVLLCLTELT